jgi:AraC-like DNA-binding protein
MAKIEKCLRIRASVATHETALVGAVRSLATDLLVSGYPDLPTVAGKAGIPVRTLQRRLACAGLTYSGLVADIRLNRARELLGDRSQPIDEIASALGYSDTANFTRAFRKRTGRTPTQYRKLVTGAPPS